MITKTVVWAFIVGLSSARFCQNLTVPVFVSARNGVFGDLKTPQTNLEATEFILASTQQGNNVTEKALTGYKTIEGVYHLSAQYCSPEETFKDVYTLQILTHGIAADKTYWDVSYNNYNYSYVNSALSRGYHTLSYDRLGFAASSHGDPKNEIQAFLEIEALASLTKRARDGDLPGIPYTPKKVVRVGHSFGSSQTYAITSKYPDISDGIVLTGFSRNTTFEPWLLIASNFQQAKSTINPWNYTAGYLLTSTKAGLEYNFFYPGHFDPKLLAEWFKTSQPATVGELLTLGSFAPKESNFKGPVMILTGENDLPFCGGNCLATGGAAESIPATANEAFPHAEAFSAVIQPQTGHGMTMHYNTTAGYQQILNFLRDHDL